MLLLTDRLTEGHRLQAALNTVEPCAVLGLHQTVADPRPPSVIVCDAALDNITSTELLRCALAQHRGAGPVPVLYLTRDPSHLAHAQALAMGAQVIMPHTAPLERILAAVRQLLAGMQGSPSGKPRPPSPVQASLDEAESALSGLFDDARRLAPLSAAEVDRGARAVIAAVGQARIRVWLDVVWKFDDFTYQHCLLVAGLVAAFARRLGLSPGHQRLLSQAALVHDIGKAQIPLAILTKPGRLTAAEFATMKLHPGLGHRMLASQPGVDPRLLDIVRHHHEYLDGTGYPDGRRGDQISQFVRLVTICDIYAALIERRPYKPPMAPPEAIAALDQMGPKLDRGLLKAFVKLVAEA